MADGQNFMYSSGSESDRMVIDLGFRSEGDTANSGAISTANETDGDGEYSPIKRMVSPRSRSEKPSELQPVGGEDLLDDILHESERSETDNMVSTNSDYDGADVVSQAEDNPDDVQEVASDGQSRIDGQDAENRLVTEGKPEDDNLEAVEKAMEVSVGDDKEMAVQNVAGSPEQGEVIEETSLHEKEAVSQREAYSPRHGDIADEAEGGEKETSAQDVKSSLQHSDTMELENDNEAISHSATSSPEHSIPFTMSETFLDNMNPQDDSQDFEVEIEGKDMEGDEQRVVRETVKEDVGDNENSDIFESQSRTPDRSYQFEMSDTFLDNLNPQDDSQDFGEEYEDTGKENEPRESEVEVKDNSVENIGTSVLERRNSSPEHTVTSSLERNETIRGVHDNDNESVSQAVSSSPKHSVLFELSETFLDNLNPQDDSQDLEEETEEKDGEKTVRNMDRDEASSSFGGEEGTGEEASHIPESMAGTEEAVSPAQQNTSVDEVSSPLKPQTPADETSLSDVLQDAAPSCEASSPSVQPNSTVSGASSPCPDKASISQDENQSVEEVKERDSDQVTRDTAGDESSLHLGQKKAAGCDTVAVECTSAEDSSPSVEWNITPEKARSPSPYQETSAGKDSSASKENGEEEPHSLPSPEGKDEESSGREDDDAREEGEYSSSPSPCSEHSESEDGNTSDVLQLSADEEEIRVKDTYKKRTVRPQRKTQLHSSPDNRQRNRRARRCTVVVDVNSDCEKESWKYRDKLDKRKSKKKDKNSTAGEDGINTNIVLDDREDNNTAGVSPLESSSKESPAVGVTEDVEKGDGENDEGEGGKTLQANVDDSDDDVQIIECPPQQIETLIVEDDDDDDIVPSTNVSSKAPVSESSRTSKKKRTVEQDGHDLRIVIRDERREKDDSDRRHRHHERDRREERRSDSHRRLESDRKSSDRSSRRRHHRSRSHSRERRRRRSRSRSHSRDRSSRRRRQRERSRDKSDDRERSSHRKRRRDRSRERRRRSHSRSRSPKRSREDSCDKENRDDREAAEHSRSKRRRYHRDEEKHRESQEDQRSNTKNEDAPPPPKQSRSWRPSDTFAKDSSESPSVAEKSDDESEESVKEVGQSNVPEDKPEGPEVDSKKEAEVMPVDIPIPEPQDIPIPKPEDIPIPETEHVPVPQLLPIPVPQPELIPGPPLFPVVLPPHPIFENPPLPPPEEEPMENPPEPPPLPPRWPEVLPTKGEGLLPTPIRRKAALEEAAAVYDPAHPTEDDGERFRFQGVPNSAHPPPEMMGGPPPEMMGGPPPRLPGQIMSDGTFVPTPGEGGILGPPPQRVPLQPGRFGPPRPMMMNHVMERPPFNNGPFPNQLPGPPLPPRFPMEMGGPGGVVPLQNQFGQGPPPPGPPPPPQGFPGQLNERFEDGPPGPPVGQFPVSVHSEMAKLGPPPGLPPPDMHLMSHPPPPEMSHPPPPDMSHPPPPDMAVQENPVPDEKFDKTLASLVMAQNLITTMNDRKSEEEPGSLPPSSMFSVPPPRLELQGRSPSLFHPSAEASISVEQMEDTIEVMDMDMSPVEGECELKLSSPPEGQGTEQDKGKKSKPLVAIDLRFISNALRKLTSAVTDDVPASAVELTNNEKYMKKLHLQERVVDEVKQALRPFYSHKKINKEEYKTILRKAVPKVCHSKSGDINPQKIQQLVEGYVDKFQKQRQHVEQKVKPSSKPASPKEKGKANGERAKPAR